VERRDCSSEGKSRSVLGAGRLPGSSGSPRVARRASLSMDVHLPVESWADACVG